MRFFLFLIVLVIAVIGGGAYYVVNNLENTIETAGSRATGTNVSLGGVNISPMDQSASLKDLAIANPAGFSNNDAVSLGNMSVALDLSRSELPGLIAVKEFRVDSPIVNYEMGGSSSNIEALQDAVNSNMGGGGGSSEGSETKFIIDRLVISGGEIRVSSGGGQIASTDIPTITLTNLGSDGNGVTGAEVGQEIFGEISGEVMALASTGAIKGLVGGATGMVGDAVGGVAGQAGDLGSVGGKATDALKKLPGFGRDND